jgi:hypothetical protein
MWAQHHLPVDMQLLRNCNQRAAARWGGVPEGILQLNVDGQT